VADIFVSYTSDDRDWAFWIGQELLKLGHAARDAVFLIRRQWPASRRQASDHISAR
jgi:hypothetical protein